MGNLAESRCYFCYMQYNPRQAPEVTNGKEANNSQNYWDRGAARQTAEGKGNVCTRG